MNPVWKQMSQAYGREAELYGQVLELVEQQRRIMETAPDTGRVLALCGQVEGLMAAVADVEAAIAPARRRWEQDRQDPEGELAACLSTIEQTIQKVARAQEQVQAGLLAYMRAHQERTTAARTVLNAGRARRLYRAG
jgi:hypothetical protein